MTSFLNENMCVALKPNSKLYEIKKLLFVILHRYFLCIVLSFLLLVHLN